MEIDWKQLRAWLIGGAAGGFAAYQLSPQQVWLGMALGFAVGFLAYEFRAALRAVPAALRATQHGAGATLNAIGSWLALPHPFLYPGAVSAGVLFGVLLIFYTDWSPWTAAEAAAVAVVAFGLFLLFSCIFAFILFIFASIGMEASKETAQSIQVFGWEAVVHSREDIRERQLTVLPLTYGNTLRWLFRSIVPTALWMMRVFARFFRYIHSEKRIACGVYCALGVLASYLLLRAMSLPWESRAVYALSAGIFSAVLGILGQKGVVLLLRWWGDPRRAES